ncbi:MAG: hypothetical protein AABZ06_09095 [Bdellovibrionota bacterium]
MKAITIALWIVALFFALCLVSPRIAAITAYTAGVLLLVSSFVFGQIFKVPWFLWERVRFDDQISYPRIIILSFFEFRQVPPNFVWVVRDGKGSDINAVGGPTGFYLLKEGWQYIFLPEYLRITIKLVDLRAKNIDYDKMVVNTKSNPVKIDAQSTYQVTDPLRYAVVVSEDPVEIIKGILSFVLNLSTSEYDDISLIQLGTDKVEELAKEATERINGDRAITITGAKAPRHLPEFGLHAVVRIQNIYAIDEVHRARIHVTAAKLEQEAAGYKSKAIQKMRKAAGLPEAHPLNIALPLIEQILGRTTAGGEERTQFPTFKANVEVDLGGKGSGKKEKSEEKSENKEGRGGK